MRRQLVLSATALAAVLAITSPAAAHSNRDGATVVCNGSATGLTINGDVSVPAGGACRLTDSTVRGDVKASNGAYFQASGTTIRGDVKGRRAQTLFIEGGSSVRGDLVGDRTSQVFVFGSGIWGRIDVQRADDKVNVCGNTVRGDIVVEESGRDILIGDPLALDCPGNVVKRGDIEIEDNFVDVELVIRGNTISRGDLDVKRNDGPAGKFVQNNAGGGKLDCRSNDTPFTASANTGWNRIAGQCKP